MRDTAVSSGICLNRVPARGDSSLPLLSACDWLLVGGMAPLSAALLEGRQLERGWLTGLSACLHANHTPSPEAASKQEGFTEFLQTLPTSLVAICNH